ELAAEALGRRDPARAAALAGEVLGDRPTFNRLLAGGKGEGAVPPRSAAGQIHAPGVGGAPPVARGRGAAPRAGGGEPKRPGGVGGGEGRAAAARPDAEAVLVEIGQAATEPEELRRAAWRGLKRSRRARKRAEAAT